MGLGKGTTKCNCDARSRIAIQLQCECRFYSEKSTQEAVTKHEKERMVLSQRQALRFLGQTRVKEHTVQV